MALSISCQSDVGCIRSIELVHFAPGSRRATIILIAVIMARKQGAEDVHREMINGVPGIYQSRWRRGLH